jgi:hypothetical protein
MCVQERYPSTHVLANEVGLHNILQPRLDLLTFSDEIKETYVVKNLRVKCIFGPSSLAKI